MFLRQVDVSIPNTVTKSLLQSFYEKEMKYKHSQPKQVLVGSVWHHKVSQIKQKCYLNLVNFLCFSGQK